MKNTIYDRLLRRETGDRTRYAGIRGIYGDRKWIQDMDIVNELEGHNGCVNALRYATILNLGPPSSPHSLLAAVGQDLAGYSHPVLTIIGSTYMSITPNLLRPSSISPRL